MEQKKLIQDFNKKFAQPVAAKPTKEISSEVKAFRIKIMQEEFAELIEAMQDDNCSITDLAKELADMQYVLWGTICAYGLFEKFDQIFAEVHRSNMSKTFNPKVGKAIKGREYKPADFAGILD